MGDRSTWAILAVGAVFAVNPLYWDRAVGVGIASFLDWLGAVGGAPGGAYYIAVGGMYLLTGEHALRYDAARDGAVRDLELGVLVSLLVVWMGTVLYWWYLGWEVGLPAVAFALSTGPVMVGFLLGAPTNRATAPRLAGLSALLVLPFAGWLLSEALWRGPATLGGFVPLLSVGLVVVLDVVWAYPLYRLGRSLRG